ncbi:LRR domain containing protein [Trema orientale]|uniref:LRR domain containing protein n=1 Tax=Trema orientale TaxID=63057 RepID=A0A2P5CW25_TREOI|nr:LRR domain containing protein [Trema orientale]
MTRLSSEQVLKDNDTRDPSTIEALTLNHRALSDVSCLRDFKSLGRLDLRLNNLTSLEGLKLCTNLKWLSVAENKLESLKGIEALTKLTVLNAGKNKINSMDNVRSITSLCAIILNDNEINSICKLDQMKDLNTLVLSRNPIGEIGDSLVKVASITKLKNINASLKSCVELKELRLAHNDIKSLPAELAYNKDLQNLDLGYNVITTWSDLKVLTSLVSLRTLNLQGNPIAENEKSVKKIKKTLPKLHVFNAKPINKYTKNEMGDNTDQDSSLIADKNPETQTEEVRDHVSRNNLKEPVRASPGSANEWDKKKKLKGTKEGTRDNVFEILSHKDEKGNQLKEKKSKHYMPGQSKTGNLENDPNLEKQSMQKSKVKNDEPQKRKVSFQEDDDATVKNKHQKKAKVKRGELDVIDDAEASFVELFTADGTEDPENRREKKVNDNAGRGLKSAGGIVTFPGKKKSKAQSRSSILDFSPAVEVGMGGASTWGDE